MLHLKYGQGREESSFIFDLFKKRTLDVLKDDNLRENLSKRALLKAQKEFSIDTMLDNYEKVFLEVVK